MSLGFRCAWDAENAGRDNDGRDNDAPTSAA